MKSGVQFTVRVYSSVLRVCSLYIADSTKLGHLQIMQSQKGNAALPTSYTLTRTPTCARIIPACVLNHTETDLFNVVVPQSIIFGMVRNETGALQ